MNAFAVPCWLLAVVYFELQIEEGERRGRVGGGGRRGESVWGVVQVVYGPLVGAAALGAVLFVFGARQKVIGEER